MKKMKLNKFFAIIGLTVIFSLSSCNDYEDVPIENFTMDYVFSRTDSLGLKARSYLLNIYGKMQNGHNRVSNEYLDTASDDGVSAEPNETDLTKLQRGQYTSTNRITDDMDWSTYYNGIRKSNTFIQNIDIVPLKETFNNNIPLNRAWKAEARFLRAYFYFELIKRYAGVPIVNDVYELGADIELPRNTFEECVDFIVEELDAIKDSLRTVPIANVKANGHVVTKEAAMALKTRVLLYAASPLFNGKSLDASNPVYGYTSYDAERWKKAADAAKWFIDTYGPNGSGTYGLNSDYKNTFLNYYGENDNKELIFYRSTGNNDKSLETNSGPIGFAGDNLANGRNSPTQNLVDAFPMIDGKPIGQSPDYNYSYETMYQNRDPRLDYTVIHNGSKWLSVDIQTYEGGTSNPRDAARKTKTSYYLRKFMGNYEEIGKYDKALHVWVMFRYAEIMLNYAEAQNEYAGPSDDVYQVIKDIRHRAGILPGNDNMYGLKASMNKDEMRAVIQNERRIEMAFEEQRYWDIRRWKIADQIFDKPLTGLVIMRNSGLLEYNLVEVFNNKFEERRYLYPIPYSEVIKNKNMIQNPKW
jgi:hypothetical protein